MRKTTSGDLFPKFDLKCFLPRIKDLRTGERGLFCTLASQGFLSTTFPIWLTSCLSAFPARIQRKFTL